MTVDYSMVEIHSHKGRVITLVQNRSSLLISGIVCSVSVGRVNIKWTLQLLCARNWMITAPQNTHPIMYMSVLPSPTFSPSKEVMSSGGVAEPTFQVMMWTLLEKEVM